jgi:hypothetical protein
MTGVPLAIIDVAYRREETQTLRTAPKAPKEGNTASEGSKRSEKEGGRRLGHNRCVIFYAAIAAENQPTLSDRWRLARLFLLLEHPGATGTKVERAKKECPQVVDLGNLDMAERVGFGPTRPIRANRKR